MNNQSKNTKFNTNYSTLQPVGKNHRLITNKSSTKLIIFFTDFQATGSNYETFDFWDIGNGLSKYFNILFVSGWCNSWYQDGVKSIGTDLNTTISSIDTWIKTHNINNVFCTGQSMGGYGALLIGGLLKAKILAFGAETILDIPYSQYSKKANKEVPIIHKDLAITFENGLDAIILAGEESPVDIYCAQGMLVIPGVTIKTLRYIGSSPATYLSNRERLRSLLLHWIENGELPDIEESGTALEKTDFPKYYYKGSCELIEKNYSLAAKELKKAIYLYPTCDEARRLLGMAYTGKKMHVEALEQFAVSYSLKPRAASLLGLADSLRFIEEYAQSRRSYLKLIKAYPNNAAGSYGLGLCYLKLNNISRALSCFSKSVELAPTNKTYKERLRVTRKL